MATYARVQHISEVGMYIGAVLARFQTVGPYSHPTIFENVVESLLALHYGQSSKKPTSLIGRPNTAILPYTVGPLIIESPQAKKRVSTGVL